MRGCWQITRKRQADQRRSSWKLLKLLQIFTSKRLHHILRSTSSDPYCSVAGKKDSRGERTFHHCETLKTFPAQVFMIPLSGEIHRRLLLLMYFEFFPLIWSDQHFLHIRSGSHPSFLSFVFAHLFILDVFCARHYTGNSVLCFHQIQKKNIQSLLSFAHVERVVHAFVQSHLDNCNSL